MDAPPPDNLADLMDASVGMKCVDLGPISFSRPQDLAGRKGFWANGLRYRHRQVGIACK
jgi:hypothetical protein